MKTIIIEIPEYKTNKIKRTLKRFKDITIYEEEDVDELQQSKKEVNAYNRALNEFKNGKTISFKEYLKIRKINE